MISYLPYKDLTKKGIPFSLYSSKTKFFRNEWNKLDPEIRRVYSCIRFRKKSFVKPIKNKIFIIYDRLEIELLTRLIVNFSHLIENKFRHNFPNTLNPLCSCSLEIERTAHFFLRCKNYANTCITLMKILYENNNFVTSWKPTESTRIILYDDGKFNYDINKRTFTATMQLIEENNRFDQSLIQHAKHSITGFI